MDKIYTVVDEFDKPIVSFTTKKAADDMYEQLNKTLPRRAKRVDAVAVFCSMHEYDRYIELRNVEPILDKLSPDERRILSNYFRGL